MAKRLEGGHLNMLHQFSKPLARSIAGLAVAFLTTMAARPAHAIEIPHAWAGGLFGLSVPNADDTTSRGMYGITAGAKLGDNLGLGAYYLTSHKDESSTQFNYDLYGVQLSYHFDGEASGAWFGGRIGTSKVTVGADSKSPLNIGVVGGYDYMLVDHLSIGGEVNWMSISEASPISGFSSLDFLAALKLWF
jgi:hypothetical protein